MLDRRRRPRLLEKPRADPVVLEQLRGDQLQRDDPVELELACAVDDAHAAAADDGLDAATGHDRPRREQSHGVCISDRTGRPQRSGLDQSFAATILRESLHS
jgi:hypothetical protein